MKFISIGGNQSKKFDKLVNNHHAFVKFYSPQCGHCVAMAPAWNDLSNKLDNYTDADLYVVEVHADAIPNIKSSCTSNIQGFPTIMEVKPGGLMGKEYNGNREADDMANFVVNELLSNEMDSIVGKKKSLTKKRSTKKRSAKKRSTKKRSAKKRSAKKRSTKKRSRRGGLGASPADAPPPPPPRVPRPVKPPAPKLNLRGVFGARRRQAHRVDADDE